MMKVHVLDQAAKPISLKVFRKKISYEGLHDRYRRNRRYLSPKQRKELKQTKKAAFRKHINPLGKGW